MLDFFINRPIFAATVALLMVICGGISMVVLPIAQFPSIVPPTVTVTSTYPGASAQVTADSVTTLLEEQINGIQGMIYMSSTSANNGSSLITVSFEVGYDLDIGAVDVQNRISQATGQIPAIVNQAGIIIEKTSTDMVLVVSLASPNGTYSRAPASTCRSASTPPMRCASASFRPLRPRTPACMSSKSTCGALILQASANAGRNGWAHTCLSARMHAGASSLIKFPTKPARPPRGGKPGGSNPPGPRPRRSPRPRGKQYFRNCCISKRNLNILKCP